MQLGSFTVTKKSRSSSAAQDFCRRRNRINLNRKGSRRRPGVLKITFLCFTVFFMGDSNFVKSKKDAYMSLQSSHFCKTEMQVEKTLKSCLVNC